MYFSMYYRNPSVYYSGRERVSHIFVKVPVIRVYSVWYEIWIISLTRKARSKWDSKKSPKASRIKFCNISYHKFLNSLGRRNADEVLFLLDPCVLIYSYNYELFASAFRSCPLSFPTSLSKNSTASEAFINLASSVSPSNMSALYVDIFKISN